MDDAGLESLLEVVSESGIDGVVATNTTISRSNLATSADRIASFGAGGLSGAPLHVRALAVVERVRARLGPAKTVIGVGGISNAAEALAMLRAGADLLQIYTGLIYGGPFIAAAIAREIKVEMDRTGAKSLADLVRA